MMEFTLDYASLAKKLESQELESPGGRASPEVYGQLLAIYLLFRDLTSAKFLWKRIPTKIKETNQELTTIWLVGKLMWRREYSNIYDVIKSNPVWPNHLKNIMNLILETNRQTASNLIRKAYSTIHISNASQLLGMTSEQTLDWARQFNYDFEQDTGFLLINKDTANSDGRVNPTSSSVANSKGSSSTPTTTPIIENRSDLLQKLTDYIVFLESN